MSTATQNNEQNNGLFSQFKKIKQSRQQVETQSKLLQNKISNLKLKEQLSVKKIEKAKALAQKITKHKQERRNSIEASETQRKRHMEELELQSKNNREQSVKCRQKILENYEKIITEKRNEYKNTRKRQHSDNIRLECEYKRKQEENLMIKSWITTDKEFWKMENDKFKDFKRSEARKDFYARKAQEKNLVYSKMKEKEIMEDVDMTILEYLLDGKFVAKKYAI